MGVTGTSMRRALRAPSRRLACVLLALSGACVVFAALAVAAVPAPSASTTGAWTPRITSLSAAADPRLGLIVTATFTGDLEHLGRGVLGLVLTPKGAAYPASGLIDVGGGISTLRVPASRRHGDQASVRSRLVELLGVERVAPVRTGRPVEVIRDGDHFVAYIGGSAVSRLGRLEVKLFASAPAGAEHGIGSAAAWRGVVRGRPSARSTLTLDGGRLTCGALGRSRATLADTLNRGLRPELSGEQSVRRLVKAALGRPAAHAPRASWQGALGLTARKVGQLRDQIASLTRLIAQLDTLRGSCAPPSTGPALTPTSSPTTAKRPLSATTAASSAPVAPSVSGVAPSSGPTTGGANVTITGSGLTGTTAVRFGSADATSFTVESDGQLTATSPAAPAGTVDVTVATPAGTSATSAADGYTYESPPPPPPAPPPVQVVQSDSALGQGLAPQPGLEMTSSAPSGVPVVTVNEQHRDQQFTGLGAAMTDSSAWLLENQLTPAQRTGLMQELFGQFGQTSSGAGLAAPSIHLNFLRVGVAATGAMTVTPAYSYDDNPPGGSDPNMTSFSIGHDSSYILPALQQALSVDPGLQILATPWSSPGWMKSNNALNNQNNAGTLLTGDYAVYASYLVKSLQAYRQAGVPIQAITPANEPTAATPYPGLNLPESAEANFIANDLQPALRAAGLDTKIYGNDLSWDQFAHYASPLASDANAGAHEAGTAWHCYFGSPTVMTQLHAIAPSKDQIVDECSPEIRSFGTPEFLISTLRNWASAASIWSLALDPTGNPIQTPNHCTGCRGAVSIDQSTGEVTFLPEYYQLGQVSAFVQPGAFRIDSSTFVTYGTDASNIETITSGLDDVAFANPDGSKVLCAYDNSPAPITFAVDDNGSYFTDTIPSHAMTTFVWR